MKDTSVSVCAKQTGLTVFFYILDCSITSSIEESKREHMTDCSLVCCAKWEVPGWVKEVKFIVHCIWQWRDWFLRSCIVRLLNFWSIMSRHCLLWFKYMWLWLNMVTKVLFNLWQLTWKLFYLSFWKSKANVFHTRK